MPVAADPHTWRDAARSRLELIEDLSAQIAKLESVRRAAVASFASHDMPFGFRAFACDELALSLAESPGTAGRLVDLSQMYVAHPAVMARVGLPLAEGGWSIRHADALLFSISGLGLSEQTQQQIVALVAKHEDARTPQQIRKAAQAAVMVLDPAAAERRLAKARKNRRVGADAYSDGTGCFWATGTASQVAMVMASIDCLAGPKQPGDPRTLDQRRFDAFMDLICGRIAPGQWQALVVMSLETLTGESDEPAEIPGYGLISAGEARDLAAHAVLRRGVVDENGELVSIDSQVHHPDLPDSVRLDEPHPDHGLSYETEPAPLDTTPEEQPSEADLAWLHDEQSITTLASSLEAELTALLTAHPHALVPAGGGDWGTPWTPIQISHWNHGPEGPGDEPDDGPDEPDEPDEPSLDDQLWAEATLDREAQDALEPPPRYEREPWTPYSRHGEPEPRWTSWTRLALTAALAKVTRTPVDPQPLTSTAYALPPRMARFVKHRDLACSFPGCTRLAWSTENDHLLPWPRGRTTPDNIDCKCKHHHQAKTHGGYQTQRLPNGGIRWTTPLGRTYDRNPRPLLRGF